MIEAQSAKRITYRVKIFFALLLVLSGCATMKQIPQPLASHRYVRVAVVQGAKDIDLAIQGQYRMMLLHTGQVIKQGSGLKKTKVMPTHSGFMLGSEPIKVFGIMIEPNNAGNILINKFSLRGSVELIRQKDMTILVINHIDVEQYLKGVLYLESSRRWSGNYLEALKAIAVAARSYALYQDEVSSDKDFGLTSDVYSQIYGGRLAERRLTNYAVNATSGMVLTYKGELFHAYHHSTCGGHTEDAAELWDVDLPPLKGVPCSFCKDSLYYRWQKNLPLSSLGQGVVGISINERNASGRARSITLKKNKEDVKMSAKGLRQFIGFDVLRSTKFDVSTSDGSAVFTGQGWGHGVGLCQWGAYGMAKEGYSYTQILKYYYPGAELEGI